ncbi:MAG: lipopolysaccharide biosynthesis protein [Myxococcota bacterium]
MAPRSEPPASTLLPTPRATELASTASRGSAWVLAAQGVRGVAQVGCVIALARWVEPAEFGRFAMALVCVGALGLFAQSGLAWKTLERDALCEREASHLFWINALSGLGLGVALLALGPTLARFFGEPALGDALAALSLGFPLQGVAVQPLALLRRGGRFGRASAVETGAALAGFAVAIGTALAGFGLWALVAGHVTTAATTACGAFAANPWRPSRPAFDIAPVNALRFGAELTGASFVNFLARNLDDVLIGRVFGAASLGFYGRAYALLLLPLSQLVAPLAQVAIPTLARLRDDPERFERVYLRFVQAIAYLCMPGCALLVVCAEDVVALALGPGWEATAPLLRWLALAGFWQPIASTASWLHLAYGRSSRLLGWSVRGGSLVIASIVLGLPFGPRGIAASYAIAVWALVGPQLRAAIADTPVGAERLRSVVLRPALLALAVALAAAVARQAVPLPPSVATAAAGAAAALVTGVVLVWAWPAGRRDAASLWASAQLLRRTS